MFLLSPMKIIPHSCFPLLEMNRIVYVAESKVYGWATSVPTDNEPDHEWPRAWPLRSVAYISVNSCWSSHYESRKAKGQVRRRSSSPHCNSKFTMFFKKKKKEWIHIIKLFVYFIMLQLFQHKMYNLTLSQKNYKS